MKEITEETTARTTTTRHAAIYARVSTKNHNQTVATQTVALYDYIPATRLHPRR
jgi:hypothetical protein